MTKESNQNNYAFIDGQNLHSGVRAAGWKLDHRKFRDYLKDELNVTKAYIFIGYMEEQQDLYTVLQDAGFILHFKPLMRYEDGTVKGNVDAELILQVMVEKDEYDQAVIVSGDGDFASLLRYLDSVDKLKQVIIPNKRTYSSLFDRLDGFSSDKATFVGDLKKQLAYGAIRKPPARRRNNSQKVSRNTTRKKPTMNKPTMNKPQKPVANSIKRNDQFKPKQALEEDLLKTIADSSK